MPRYYLLNLETKMRAVTLTVVLILSAAICGACSMAGVGSTIGAVSPSAELKKGSKYPVFWPPKAGEKFPDLHVTDSEGRPLNLSKYEGKVVLVEEIGMTCGACNAFCGGNKTGGKGPFDGQPAQNGLPDIEEYMQQQGININDPNFVKVDFLLYDTKLQAPTVADAKAWKEHFYGATDKKHVVVVGDKSLLGQESYDLIPGFQLLDKSFTVVSDSSGHAPKDDLWTVLVPKVKAML
jgi:thiol-disulfide isomerase/thioredoxin